MIRCFLRHLFGLFSRRRSRLARPDQCVLSPPELRRRILLEQSKRRDERSGVLLVADLSIRTRPDPEQFAALIRFCLDAVGSGRCGRLSGFVASDVVLPDASERDVDEIIDQLRLAGGFGRIAIAALVGCHVCDAPVASMFLAGRGRHGDAIDEFHAEVRRMSAASSGGHATWPLRGRD